VSAPAESPSIVVIPSPFRGDRGRVKLLEPPDCNRRRIREELLSGDYRKPFVLEEQGSRSLHFSRALVQSGMRLDDPCALEFAYTRHMMAFLLFVREPRSLLMLGLGGGSLAKYCHRNLPSTRVTVVEIDPHVIAFRQEFRVPPDGERFAVVRDDAAGYVTSHAGIAEVILMDAFDREGISASLSTRDFYADARRALSKGGVLVVNLVGEHRQRIAHLERIRTAFEGNVIFVPVEEDGNHVAFAFRDALFEPRWRRIEADAHGMRKRYELDFPALAKRLERSRKLGYLARALRKG